MRNAEDAQGFFRVPFPITPQVPTILGTRAPRALYILGTWGLGSVISCYFKSRRLVMASPLDVLGLGIDTRLHS